MTSPAIASVPRRQRSILVVDDVAELVATVAAMLVECGYRARTARGVREAVKLLEQERFDVVVTDITMPEADGFEFIRQLMRDECRPRIVAMTGGNAAMWADDCAKVAHLLGADATLVKPFELSVLLEAIAGPDAP